jgi:aryl-alcohol dehydrogenase-like predicted oxidoreductase
MRYRSLGDSNIEVSEISLGSWLTYGAGVQQEQTEACTRAAFEADINFFDTSNVYGVGAAEAVWGEMLEDYERDSYVLATKVFFPVSETDRGLSREQIHKQLDASLGRLRTDYVDLYQCHRPDPDTPIEETMEALTEVVEQGKVREIGFSEWTVEQVQAGLEVPNTRKWVSSQPQYNVIWRAPEAELIPFCRRHGISQIVWSPVAQGVLTGKYRPGEQPPPDSRAASDEMSVAIDRYMSDEVLEGVRVLDRKPGKDVWIAEADAGTFLGDIATFTGEPAIAECVADEQTDVIFFDRSQLRAMLAAWPEMAEPVLRTMMARREWHAEHGYGVLRLIAPRGSRRAFEVRDLLERNLIPVRWYDVDTGPESATMLDWLQIPREETPLLVRNTAVLCNPSAAQVARELGLRAEVDGERFDLVVLGGVGPPGWRPPCTAGPRACARSWSKRGRRAGRPAPARGSRTTLASPPGSPAAS